MLSIQPSNKTIERQLELSPASQPSTMNAVAGAINVAIPKTLQANQDIRTVARAKFLDLVGESDWRSCGDMHNSSKRPIFLRPICCRKKLRFVTAFDHTTREALQICLGATALRIATSHKADADFFCAHVYVRTRRLPFIPGPDFTCSMFIRIVVTGCRAKL